MKQVTFSVWLSIHIHSVSIHGQCNWVRLQKKKKKMKHEDVFMNTTWCRCKNDAFIKHWQSYVAFLLFLTVCDDMLNVIDCVGVHVSNTGFGKINMIINELRLFESHTTHSDCRAEGEVTCIIKLSAAFLILAHPGPLRHTAG